MNYTRTGSTPNRSYTASCTKVVDSKTVLTALTPGNTGWTNLTDNTAGSGTGESAVAETNYGQSLLVLPQTTYTGEGAADNKLEAYDHTAALGNTGKCACIAIKCKIRNIAGTEVKDNDVYLWGSATEAKDLVVPVDFTWEQGKKYIYRNKTSGEPKPTAITDVCRIYGVVFRTLLHGEAIVHLLILYVFYNIIH